MFEHRQSSDRRAGIKWRLDMLTFEKYIAQKGYTERAEARDFYNRMLELKKHHIIKTKNILDEEEEKNTNEVYELLSELWV